MAFLIKIWLAIYHSYFVLASSLYYVNEGIHRIIIINDEGEKINNIALFFGSIILYQISIVIAY